MIRTRFDGGIVGAAFHDITQSDGLVARSLMDSTSKVPPLISSERRAKASIRDLTGGAI